VLKLAPTGLISAQMLRCESHMLHCDSVLWCDFRLRGVNLA
jgi:hypothetical protein